MYRIMCRFLVTALALACAPAAFADTVFVTPGDYTGERNTPASFGINPNGQWATVGMKLSWEIEESGGVFTYEWRIRGLNGTLQAVSHSIFETSLDFTVDDVLAGSSTVSDDSPKQWASGQGNPGMPASGVFGIKFDFGSSDVTYTLVTRRRPVWGDFYSKDGGDNYAYNTGFGTDPTASTTSFTNWIPTPDTATVVPLPAAAWMGMMLLGGVGGAGYIRRRRLVEA